MKVVGKDEKVAGKVEWIQKCKTTVAILPPWQQPIYIYTRTQVVLYIHQNCYFFYSYIKILSFG